MLHSTDFQNKVYTMSSYESWNTDDSTDNVTVTTDSVTVSTDSPFDSRDDNWLIEEPLKTFRQKMRSKWKEKKFRRRCSFVLIGIYLFLDGLEGGFVVPTLWLLFENKFGLSSNGYFLGLTVSSFCAASLVCSPLFGKLSDRFQSAKPLLLSSCVIRIFGNALYCASQNKWYVYFGRVLSGVGAAVTPALVADVARATRIEERTKIINAVFVLRNVGNVIGYVVVPAFNYFNFRIGAVVVDRLTASGFVAALLFLAQLCLAAPLYFDLSSTAPVEEEEERRGDGAAAAAGAEAGAEAAAASGFETAVVVEKAKANFLASLKSTFAAFKKNVIREPLLIAFSAAFSSMFSLGAVETAVFPLLEEAFGWNVFNHAWVFFGALLVGVAALVAIFRIGQRFSARVFLFAVLVASCGALAFSGVAWTLALRPDVGTELWLLWRILVGVGAFAIVVCLNVLSILPASFLSVVFDSETQGIGQGYLQTVKMIGMMLGPLWGATWRNVPAFIGVQFGLIFVVTGMFTMSWDRMNPRIETDPRPSPNIS